MPAAVLMYFSPEPDQPPAPPHTLREAVWEPFVGFLRQHRALEIIAFLVLYKFGDNLASALVSPFLIGIGFDQFDVGVAFFFIGFGATIVGSLIGGATTTALGLGHSLWIFGLLQAFANVGYVLVAQAGVDRPLMYVAMAIESATTGMGTGAFAVLLLRLTEKRFSATQYALLSSIFAIGRTIAGPIAGVLADAMGWRDFFLLTIVSAVPGLAMLWRFVPPGVREPTFAVETKPAGPPLRRRAVLARAVAGAILGLLAGALCSATLGALRAMRQTPGSGFDPLPYLVNLVRPTSAAHATSIAAVTLFAASVGLGWAALAVGRRGLRSAGDATPGPRS